MSENNNLNEVEPNEKELQLDNKKTILSWSFYDWANSAFATTVMAGFFPAFFRQFWAGGVITDLEITTYLGLVNSISSIIIVILAPFLGTVADQMSGKKKFLFTFALLGILSTGLLFIVASGFWLFALVLYLLGALGFSGANIFYDALLPSVASEKKIDYVSSLGFSLGYIGGGLLFLVNVIMVFLMEDTNLAIKLSFISVAIWWAVFSIPIMLFVKEPKTEGTDIGLGKAFILGWKQLYSTLKKIRHLKYVGLFLLGYWFYIDGVDTIIRMAVEYGGSLFQDDASATNALMAALLLTQFVAFPGTMLFNKYAEKVGIKNGILTAIGAYIVITVLGFFMNEIWHFFVLAFLIGCFQGGIQALSRSLYSRLIPKEQSAEYYGFFNMLGKFAAVIGPLLMVGVTNITGDIRYGILSLVILFVIGGILLFFVNIEKGEQMAKEFLSN